MPDDVNRASSGRVRSLLTWLFSLRHASARTRSWLLAVSAVLFLVVSAASFRSLTGRVDIHWAMLPLLVPSRENRAAASDRFRLCPQTRFNLRLRHAEFLVFVLQLIELPVNASDRQQFLVSP